MGAARMLHCMGRASFSPPGMLKLGILNQALRGPELRDSCEQPLLSPCSPTWAHSSSTASGYRNRVYLLLFLNWILCPHKASVTQNTAPPQPAQMHSTRLPAATLPSCGATRTESTCQELKHPPSVGQAFPLGCCFTCAALLSPQDPART